MNSHQPPKLPLRFFRWFCHPDYREDIEGDLLERFERRVEENGARKARWLFAAEVLQLFRLEIMKPFETMNLLLDGMLSNHLKLTLRGMRKSKFFSSLSVFGLALGIACTMGIFLWVSNELSFDQFHSKTDRIFQVELILRETEKSVVTPAPLAAALVQEYPDIVNATRYTYKSEEVAIAGGDRQTASKGASADPAFFQMFDFPFEQGDTSGFSGNAIVLTKSLADRLFEKPNPIGELVTLGNNGTYMVAAVLKDLPQNSSFQFEYLMPFPNSPSEVENKAWGAWFCATFIQLGEHATPESLLAGTNGFKTFYNKIEKPHWSSELIALPDIYFHQRMTPFFPRSGDIRYVWIFSIAGVLIFILTCVNYVSLTTSRFVSQLRQAGLERILGANRIQIIHRYFVEATVSMTLGLVVAGLLLFGLKKYTGIGQAMVMPADQTAVVAAVIGLLGVMLLVIAVAPVLLINNASPLAMLRKQGNARPAGISLRRALVVFQFCVSIAMVTGTLIFQQQLTFIRDRDLGYDKEGLLAIKIDEEARKNLDALENTFSQYPDITKVSRSTFEYIYFDMQIAEWDGKVTEGSLTVRPMNADDTFAETFKIGMAEGRFFEEGYADEQSVVINQQAANEMGLQSPVGKTVKLPRSDERIKIIGVVNDFNYWGLTKAIEPLFIFKGNSGDLYIRLAGQNTPETLAYLKESFEKLNPASMFSYEFLDDRYRAQHSAHERTGEVFGGFGVIALIMSCFSLLAIITFTIERKTKEIGIRKVHGAAPRHIIGLLMKDLALYLAIAFLVSAPLIWLGMDRWLQIFSYRISLSVWQLLPGGLLVAVVAMVAVALQTIKAAHRNPVNALRNE